MNKRFDPMDGYELPFQKTTAAPFKIPDGLHARLKLDVTRRLPGETRDHPGRPELGYEVAAAGNVRDSHNSAVNLGSDPTPPRQAMTANSLLFIKTSRLLSGTATICRQMPDSPQA
jgi:hypothetical protein